MTNKSFMTLLDDLYDKERSILEKKAEIYSREQDRMHNFKCISKLLDMKPPFVAFTLLMKHFVALQDWLHIYNKDRVYALTPEEFRKIEEWILDIRNYLALIYAMLFENIELEE